MHKNSSFFETKVPYGRLSGQVIQARASIEAGMTDGTVTPGIGNFADTCLALLGMEAETARTGGDDAKILTPGELLSHGLMTHLEVDLERVRQVPVHAEGLEVIEAHLIAAALVHQG